MFGGSIVINMTPAPIRFITGYLVGWTSYYLFTRVVKSCLPFVKERLDNTAKLKNNPSYDWTPPVQVNQNLHSGITR